MVNPGCWAVVAAFSVMIWGESSRGSDDPPIVDPLAPLSLTRLPTPLAQIADVALSPDGSLLVTGSEDGELTVWNTKDGHLRRTIRPGPPREPQPDRDFEEQPTRNPDYQFWTLSPIAFDSSGATIAVSTQWGMEQPPPDPKTMSLSVHSLGTSVEIWKVEDGRKLATIDTSKTALSSLAFEPSGTCVVAINLRSEALTWAIQSRQPVDRFGAIEEEDVNFSVNGNQEAITFDRSACHAASVLDKIGDPQPVPKLRLWDFKSRKLRLIDPRERGWFGPKMWFGAVTFSPDGRLIAAAAADRTIRLIDFETATLTGTLAIAEGFAQSRLAFRPDGRQLIAINQEGEARTYDVASKGLVWSAKGVAGKVRAIHWSEDRLLIVAGGLHGRGNIEPITLYTLAIPKL